MQNQRKLLASVVVEGGVSSQVLYANAFDCFAKTFRNEGLVGFYRGIGPQLVGVAPEKALKLLVNDMLRSYFSKVPVQHWCARWGLTLCRSPRTRLSTARATLICLWRSLRAAALAPRRSSSPTRWKLSRFGCKPWASCPLLRAR